MIALKSGPRMGLCKSLMSTAVNKRQTGRAPNFQREATLNNLTAALEATTISGESDTLNVTRDGQPVNAAKPSASATP